MIKVLVAALVVLGLLFLALLWTVAYLAQITFWLPGTLTAVVLLLPVVWFAVRQIQARRSARGLERALAAQAQQQAQLTRPDLQMEVLQMQTNFEKAVAALKQSKLGARGRDALYLLPWYAIIGPPGVGKTTALRHSGLKFPYLSPSGGGVKGVGGTRNCDWWLTNQAVVLDTAGRWATQEEDHEEWLAFLDLLVKHRSKKPLNGLIAAVSVADLAGADPGQLKVIAERMRQRIDEVGDRLRVTLPVYLLFTKCDLVPGFVEMFDDMSRTERAQVWGFTAPLVEPIGEAGDYFQKRLQELVYRLENRAVARLSEERRIDARFQIYEFPQQLRALVEVLGSFVSTLFQENIYRESPRMRGAYFSSGTQEGRPIDRIMSRLAAAIGIESPFTSEQPVVDRKSYFLHDVFMKVIFEDRDLAAASQSALRRRRWRNRIATAALLLVALVVGVTPTFTWQSSRELLLSTASLVEARAEAAGTTADSGETEGAGAEAGSGAAATAMPEVDELEPLRERIETLAAYREHGAPWSMGYGMYRGDELLSPLRDFYAFTFGREVAESMMAAVVRELSDFGWKYATLVDAAPDAEEHAKYRELLKLHLLLSAPREPGEPELGPEPKRFVTEQLVERWARATNREDADSLDLMRRLVELYLDGMERRPSLAFVRDAEVVKRARIALNRVSGSRLALQRIVEQLGDEGYDLSLASLVGSSAAISAGARIRGAFTRRAWEEKVRDHLLGAIDPVDEAWVLGKQGSREAIQRQNQARLADAYFRAYIEEWQQFIRSINTHRPEDNQQALILLQDLTRGQPPPLGRLIAEIHRNVDLAAGSEPAGSTKGEGEDEKEASVLDRLAGAVDGLKQRAKSLGGSPSAGAGAAAAVDAPDLLKPKDVSDAFAGLTRFAVPPKTDSGQPPPPVDLDVYQEQLAFVRDALLRQKENSGEDGELTGILQLARTRIQALIETQDIGWRPRFKALLWPPIEGATVTSAEGVAQNKSHDWCSEVVAPFQRTLAGRYPFDPKGHDALLSDFTAFYRPHTGVLWLFYDKRLEGIAPREGERFVFETKLGADAGSVYESRLLAFLERSWDISSVFFPRESTEPVLLFEVRIHPSAGVATTTFAVGGQSIDYHNGPEQWSRLSWPGENPAEGAAFIVRGANGMHERVRQDGEWGLFRLLEAGTVTRQSDRLFSVGWRLQTHGVDISMDFRPKRGQSPFYGVPGREKKKKLMHPLRIPAAEVPLRILRGGERCQP